jgi:GWxTD domain-containing protein
MIFSFLFFLLHQNDFLPNIDYRYFYHQDTLYLNLEYKISYSDLIFIYDQEKGYKNYLLFQLYINDNLFEKVDTTILSDYEETVSSKNKTGFLNIAVFSKSLKNDFKIFIKDLNSEREFEKKFTLDLRKPNIFIKVNHREDAYLTVGDSLIFQIFPYQLKEPIFYQIINPEERIIERDSVTNYLKIYLTDINRFSQSGNYRIEFFKERFKKPFSFYFTIPFYLSDKEYFKKIAYLIYVATPKEMEELKKAKREERLTKWQEFWEKKDISEEEYFRKVAYCEKNFSRGDKGVFSDRAKIYFQYGEPDYIENFPYEVDRKPYIKWYYYQYNKVFTFVDFKGFGEYILVSEK